MNNETIKAALIRAMHAFWQALAALVPAGVVITPAMIKALDWRILYVVLAWLATALLAAALSFIKSMAVGMPEVKLTETLYDLDNKVDPDEAEDEDEDEAIYDEGFYEDEEEGDM